MPADMPIRPTFERAATIRFSHCDPAGIVFYPQYLVMFNGLLEDWVTEGLGVPFAQLIAERRVGLPTVSLNCDFTAVSRMGDAVTLGLAVAQLGSRSIKLVLTCMAGAALRVKVQQVLVTTSLETHRAIEIPPDLREAMGRFIDPEISN